MLPAWSGLSVGVFKRLAGVVDAPEHTVVRIKEGEQSYGLSKAREGVVSIQATECIGKNWPAWFWS